MAHQWHFSRTGGVDQVVFRSGQDIAHLGELDQKLWAALACPTRGLEFDTRTLDLIDTNDDGRIRAPELIAAAEWACARLRDPDVLLAGGDTLALDALATGDEAGQALADEARAVLGLLGRPDGETLALADVADRSKLLAETRFDGDGVITAAVTDDADVAAVLADIITTQGAVQDRRGQPGLDRAHAKAFFEQADAVAAWQARSDADPAVAPLGGDTASAVAALDAVRAKVDDYFARCRVAAFDPRSQAALNPGDEVFKALSAQALRLDAAPLADLPLALVAPHRPLPLDEGLNPFWDQAVQALRERVITPLSGGPQTTLDDAQWQQLQDKLAPARAWLTSRPDNAVARLPSARITAVVAPALRAAVQALLDQEEAAGHQHGRIAELDKLLHLKRDLLLLLNNFVSFKSFYRREGAIFQAGTLFLDARSCDLSVQVDDVGKHAKLAAMAKAYLAYCECRRDGKTMHVVSAFTAGDVDFLFVGRNGVFYDRAGRDWDATITRIIENPTSVAQAFFLPYKKFLRMLEEQVAKRAAASEARAQNSLGATAGRVALAGQPAAAATPAGTAAKTTQRPPTRFDVGTVAALGVAFGSLSAVAVAVFAKFVDLGWWIPVALLCIVLAISGPSMLIAWLKLRQRSLGPLLDASGWAVNGRLRINVRLGASLSQTARVPADAKRELGDPYAERHGLGYTLAAVAVLLALVLTGWRYGLFNSVLPRPLEVPVVAPASADAAASAPVVVPAAAVGGAVLPR